MGGPAPSRIAISQRPDARRIYRNKTARHRARAVRRVVKPFGAILAQDEGRVRPVGRRSLARLRNPDNLFCRASRSDARVTLTERRRGELGEQFAQVAMRRPSPVRGKSGAARAGYKS